MTYILSTTAEDDLYRIWQRGAREYGTAQADRYFHAFFEQFDKIAQNPYLYQAVDHIRQGYRRSVCGSDSIYFRVADDQVEIMAILGQQDTRRLI